MQAIDTTQDTSETIGCLKENGVVAVGRYYSRHRNWKCIERPEAEALSKAGIQIFAVYQDRQTQLSDFGEANGRRAAREALSYAQDVIGQPHGSAIYFAVDYDASAQMANGAIRQFFAAIGAEFRAAGSPYQIGVYGSGLVNRMLFEQGLVDYCWLSQSSGHREHHAFRRSGTWHLAQGPVQEFCGLNVDSDEINGAKGDFGGFLLGGDTPSAGISRFFRGLIRSA